MDSYIGHTLIFSSLCGYKRMTIIVYPPQRYLKAIKMYAEHKCSVKVDHHFTLTFNCATRQICPPQTCDSYLLFFFFFVSETKKIMTENEVNVGVIFQLQNSWVNSMCKRITSVSLERTLVLNHMWPWMTITGSSYEISIKRRWCELRLGLNP